MRLAEKRIKNTFHCQTADCTGWAVIEDNVNTFRCPVCSKVNCLTCQVSSLVNVKKALYWNCLSGNSRRSQLQRVPGSAEAECRDRRRCQTDPGNDWGTKTKTLMYNWVFQVVCCSTGLGGQRRGLVVPQLSGDTDEALGLRLGEVLGLQDWDLLGHQAGTLGTKSKLTNRSPSVQKVTVFLYRAKETPQAVAVAESMESSATRCAIIVIKTDCAFVTSVPKVVYFSLYIDTLSFDSSVYLEYLSCDRREWVVLKKR